MSCTYNGVAKHIFRENILSSRERPLEDSRLESGAATTPSGEDLLGIL